MHRFNSRYGYGRILKQYCGVPADTPIWGEVQHSLFMNTRYFSADDVLGPEREQLRRFPRLLSWQTILPFPHQLPIGMPLGYFLRMHQDEFVFPPGYENLRGEPFTLAMPRMDKDLSIEERVRRYRALVDGGKSSGDGVQVVIAPHPSEVKNRDVLEAEFSKDAIILWRGKADAIQETIWSFALMQHATELWSNYFGAHVFQAAAFFRTPTRIIGDSVFRPTYHPNINAHLHTFTEAEGDITTQAEVASNVLGLQHLKSPEELRHILGFTGIRKLLGKPVRYGYRKMRQRSVHKRQALGIQSVEKNP